MTVWISIGLGLVLLVIGGEVLVRGASMAACKFGVSPLLIGLTLVGFGTSTPELVTSVIAALRRQGDVARGNIIGSNLYNLLGILGVTAIIKPVPVPPEMLAVDVWMLAAATGAMILFAFRGLKIFPLEGLALVAGYGGYLTWLLWTAGAFGK